MIEIRLLTYFLAIAREQSITRAAKALHITQPTLSRQISGLEKQLGKKLFIRGEKNITLTKEGEFLRSRAQEIIELADKTEAAFHMQETISNDIYLGCEESSNVSFLTSIFKKLRLDYPHLRFHIYSGEADEILSRLASGELDIGLLIEPIQRELYHYFKLSLHDCFGILMPENSVLARKDKILFEDIVHLPLILPNQSYIRRELSDWFGDRSLRLNAIATYSQISNAAAMVEQGLGYAFCLKNLVNAQSHRHLAFRPFYPEIKADSFLVTSRERALSPAANIFMESMKESLYLLPLHILQCCYSSVLSDGIPS